MEGESTPFPALFRIATSERIALARGRPLLVGRGTEADHHLDSLTCSRRQFRIVIEGGACVLQPLSSHVPTLHNGEAVTRRVRLEHGDRIDVESFRFVFLEHEEEAAVATMLSGSTTPVAPRPRALDAEIPIDDVLVVGRGPPSGLILEHPMVSRRHAIFFRRGSHVLLRDLGSQNGTYVGGERVRGDRTLVTGDRIDIGPYVLELTERGLVESTRQGSLRICGRGLSRRVRASDGRTKTILDDVSVVLQPGEFSCLIGPSGSGKTTLMDALCARMPADEGEVLFDGVSLYAHFELLKRGIALVPQHELLPATLSVRQAVEATARLRLPPDTQGSEITRLVEEALEQVELTAQAETRIGNLSGGQRKRASLATEIVCRPDVLFLDEVTSGLDEATDREMMKLFARLARTGTTVVCVTHTLANVEESCDTLVVMAPGGALAFAGSPRATLQHFGIERLSEVYGALARRTSVEWALAFRQHEAFTRRMAPHLGPSSLAGAPRTEHGPGLAAALRGALHQWRVLVVRHARIVVNDRRTLALSLAQAALIGALVAVVFDPEPASLLDGVFDADAARARLTMVFLLGVCAIWFGCNNTAKELVKERALYRRERDVGLSLPSYLASKLCVQLPLGVLQVLLLTGAVMLFGTLPTPFADTFAVLTLSLAAGTGLGLLLSASCSSEEQAATLVPMAVLPQILLAGSLAPLRGALEGAAQLLVSGYWANLGLERLLDDGGGGPADDADDAGLRLALQFAAFVLATAIVLALRDRRGPGRWGTQLIRWVARARAR